ncbi:MAG: hypothetical protein ABIK89_22160 [Planctomycetota bacterium]
MSKDKEKLSDAERKAAREHSRRFTKWLREGMNSHRRESRDTGGPPQRKVA